MPSQLKYSEWLPVSARQSLAPVYIFFGILQEEEREKILERASINTLMELSIISQADAQTFSSDPVGLRILTDQLREKNIDCIIDDLTKDADWQKVNQLANRYRKEIAARAPSDELPPSFDTVINAVFHARAFIRDNAPDITDDQFDNVQYGLFHHAVSDCLFMEEKKRKEEANPTVPVKESSLVSQSAQSHLKGFSKLQCDIPDPDWNEITKEGRIHTCKTFGIREDQFLDYLNNPKKTAAVAKTLYAQVKIMAAEYNYMCKQTAATDRRIDAFLKEPGEGSSTIKTPTRDEVRGAIELAVILVKARIPRASLDAKDRPAFHNCISELLKVAAECRTPPLPESHPSLADILSPATRKSTALVKYQA